MSFDQHRREFQNSSVLPVTGNLDEYVPADLYSMGRVVDSKIAIIAVSIALSPFVSFESFVAFQQ